MALNSWDNVKCTQPPTSIPAESEKPALGIGWIAITGPMDGEQIEEGGTYLKPRQLSRSHGRALSPGWPGGAKQAPTGCPLLNKSARGLILRVSLYRLTAWDSRVEQVQDYPAREMVRQ